MAAAVRMLILPILALSGLALVGAGAALAEPSPLRLAAPASPNAAASSDWYAESPPLAHNFDSFPPIESERPLRDARRRLEAAGG